jgi:hypothetical protein
MTFQTLETIQLSSRAQSGLGMRGSHSGKSLVESIWGR